MGKLSRGCRACKDRRVKCDETVPSCLRCVRQGRLCPGYEDITFRNNLSTDSQGKQIKLPATNSKHGTTSQNGTIAKAMPTDWHSQAIGYFFHDYVIPPRESTVGLGFLQNLPTIWSKSPYAAAYQQAVSAVALVSFAHRSSLDYLATRAQQHYGKALQLSNATLRQKEELAKDSTLATVLCLGFYEVISGETPSGTKGWSCHVDILEYLLHVRRLAPQESADSLVLSTNAHISLMIRNLSKRLRPGKEAALIINDTRKEKPVREAGNLMCEVCDFLVDADEFLQFTPLLTAAPGAQDQLDELVRKGYELDRKLDLWSQQASGQYVYTSMEAPDCSLVNLPATTQSRPVIHIYSSGTMGCLWNVHRCTRIKLLQTLQDCIQHQHHTYRPPPIEAAGLETKLQNLYDAICASVPYLLGEIDQYGRLQEPRQRKAIGGYLLVWPLRLLLFRGPSDKAQRAWIMKRLTYIRAALGVQQATFSNI